LSFIAVVPDLQYTIDMDRKTLERLLEIGEQLSRTRSLQPLLHYTMEVAIDLVGAECGYLVWLNDDGSFTYKVCIDQNGQHIPTPDEQISHTILQDVIQQKSPLVVYDAMSDPGLQNSQSVTDLKLRSVLCVPLISKGEALGGFYVENRSQSNLFTEDDIQPLEFLASQVTAAIENALLNEDLERRIANRTAEKAIALAEKFKQLGNVIGTGLDGPFEGPYDLIINGTAASIKGIVPTIPDGLLKPDGAAYDMFYAKEPTAFVEWAKQQGAAIATDGFGMLIEQAAESFYLWRLKRPDTKKLLNQFLTN